MPKVIDVALIDIQCIDPGPNDIVEISGQVFGATFQNDPNNPNDQKSRHEIFTFPDGPIRLTKGQKAPVTAAEQFPKESVSFPLSTPSTEDPNLFPKFLKVAADLNGLGTQFQNIRFDDGIVDVPLTPRPLQLVFTSGSLLIRLEFLLNEQNPF
jgi:hypothetical protein